MTGRVGRNALLCLTLALALFVPFQRQAGIAHASPRTAKVTWKVVLFSPQPKVDPGTEVTFRAVSYPAIGNGKHFIHIVDVTDGVALAVCDALPCPATDSSDQPAKRTYQALLLDSKGKTVAFSKPVHIKWLKNDTWDIKLLFLSSTTGVMPLGASADFTVTVDQALETKHYLIVLAALPYHLGDGTAKSEKCAEGKRCDFTFASPDTAGTWEYFATVYDSEGKYVVYSREVRINWKQLGVSLTTPDAATVGVWTDLGAHWTIGFDSYMNSGLTFTFTADGQDIAQSTPDCNKQNVDNPEDNSCSIKVLSYKPQPVAYQVVMSYRNKEIGRSLPRNIVWKDDLGVELSVLPRSSIVPNYNASVVAGSKVTLTATANRNLAPDEFVSVYDENNLQILKCGNGERTCEPNTTVSFAGPLKYYATVTSGQAVKRSNVISVYYMPDFAVDISADSNTGIVGSETTVTATISPSPNGTLFKAFIYEDTGNGRVQVKECPGGYQVCTAQVTSDKESTVTYSVEVHAPNGEIMLDSEDKDVSASTTINWTKSSLTLSATPNRTTYALGSSIQLTLNASPAADGTTTFLKIIGPNGTTVADCHNAGATCEGPATPGTIGTVTYTGEVIDAKGTELDSTTLAINVIRVQVVVALSGASSSEVPVGKTVSIEASATPDLQGKGYTLSVSIPGQTEKCPSFSGCKIPAESDSPQQVTFTAQVTDDETGQVVSDPVTQSVTWVPFSLTVSANPGTTVPVGQKVTVSMSAAPADPDFTVSITGGGGSYTCPAPSGCDSDIPASSTAQSLTYTVEVKDKATGTTRASQQITITWQAVTPPCGTGSFLTVSPTSVGPNDTVTTTYCGPYAPNGTVDMYFDGQKQANYTLDASGQWSGTWTLHNATPGQHSFDAYDSAGGQGHAVFTVTGSSGGGGGGGGGGCGGVSVSSFTANPPNPTSGQNVTLTAIPSATIPSGCLLKISDYNGGTVGYIYTQCDGSYATCTQDVPVGNPSACSSEGIGTCTYAAFIAVRGTNTPISGKQLTVTWSGYAATVLGLQDLSALSHVVPPAMGRTSSRSLPVPIASSGDRDGDRQSYGTSLMFHQLVARL